MNKLLQWITILTFILNWLCVEDVLCLDFHLFEDWSKTTPLLLFNASLGDDWSYSFDRGPKWLESEQVEEALSIDSSSGIFYLHRQNICKLPQNPFQLTLISRSRVHHNVPRSANITIIPLTLHYYNALCSFPSHRKLRYSKHFKPLQIIVYSNYFLIKNNQRCLENNKVLIDVSNYIPYTIKQSVCDLKLVNTNLVIENKFHIKSLNLLCTDYPQNTVDIFGVIVQCQGNDVPFKITFHVTNGESSLLAISGKRTQHHDRLKRSTLPAKPTFPQESYQKSVPENQPSGYTVAHLTASDSDDGEAGKITYTLVSTRNELSNNMFTIDPISGLVKTTQPLDRETIPEHTFKVIATDGSPYRMSGTAVLTVNVQDENDHTPSFSKNVYSITKEENLPVMTTVITLRATDKDQGSNAAIQYSIIEPVPSPTFQIDPASGSIYTLKVLDREEMANYRLVVQAKDQAAIDKKSSSATVNIIVEDENDNFPQFTKNSYTVSVVENLDVSSRPVIVHVSATDADEGPNQEITYSITGGNFGDTFYIDAINGAISVQKPLDYEQHKDFSLRVKASDNGGNGEAAKTNSTTVWVRVSDINDNSPYFESPIYQGTVLENEGVDSSVLTVHALDDDSGINQILVYSIKNPPASLPFRIDPDLGKISVQSVLDREKEDTYDFTVQVEDKGDPPLSATASVHITVRDVNDNSPIFSQKTYFVTVSEDTPQYKSVIQVSANDTDIGDNALLSYIIISGNNDKVFSIAEETGIITLAKKLDFKIQNRYILTVRAKDNGDRYDTAEVHINVTDINKHVPTFKNLPYEMYVDENSDIGENVGKVSADDDDVGENGRITYELQEGVLEFEIDPNTGVISTREVLDRELKPFYAFDVKASDHGSPVFSDTAGVHVYVRDINDNPPQFDKPSYEGSVSEAAFDGSGVLQVNAVDVDEDAQVHYKFAAGSDGTRDFEIDGTTGEIRVARNSRIDREVQSNYTLYVIAYDGGAVPLTSTVEVRIEIEDINDNEPVFASDEIIAMVPENKKIGSTVAVVEAVDPDEGPNAVVEYSFEGGLDADKFLLQKRTGEPAVILNHIDLDYESDQKEFEILLKASSGNLFSLAVVKIQVQDVNDNQPILKDFTIIFNNFFKNFPEGPIGRVPAFDPDVSDRDKLRYSFLPGNEAGFLHLNESTGEITLDSRLNSDVPRSRTFQVKVTDGLNEVKATCSLYVRLVTMEMLQTSVTIRLNDMTSSAFLSPLFTFFVRALATILQTDESDIFVINVKNDTDVLPAQILNVTVAVREKSVKVNREIKDIFYSAEYLQEQIYLQRTLLANRSYLQVLPFDDNLCVDELCYYFEKCLSWLNFGMAAPFISSDTMFFRPIYPENGYRCSECPRGFTGMGEYDYLCDVEVDYCYSNPCNNSGVCERTEGGYTCRCKQGFAGKNCEIDLSTSYDYESCPTNLCKPPSFCQPLIDGGFRCDGCPNQEHYNQFCQLTTRSFPKGSFLMFPSLKMRHRFTVQLKFSTQQRNGLLFYNGRFNEKHDFIALEIVDGQVQFSFSLGNLVSKVSPYIEGGVNDGRWHQVTVEYLNKTATVTVGEDCDTEISVRFGQPINYTCAARVTYKNDPECGKPKKKPCYKLLDLTGPLQIGGLPTLPTDFQIQNKDFDGCMKDFLIDEELLDFNASVANNGTEIGCPNKQESCRNAPCQHGGNCIEGWGTYMCQCRSQWGGKDCSQEIDPPRRLRGDGYIYYNRLIPPVHFTWYNGISFRTRHKTGTLMYIVAGVETIHIELEDGYILYTYTNSLTPQQFLFEDVAVDDGQWHYFEARWRESGHLIMLLDYGQRQKIATIQSSLAQKAVDHVYVGAQKFGSLPSENNFIGCIENVRVGNTQNSVLQRPQIFNATEGCTSVNPCTSDPCPAQATCVDEWEDYSCQCPPGTLGPDCLNICTNFNPCQNMAHCRHPQGGSYQCECGSLQSGDYCENVAKQPCPAKWWGYPVCGPCHENCTRENGFNPSCDKTTGKCSCMTNYYQPPGSYTCVPCNCYHHGSKSLQCDRVTGQCPCIEGIIGKRCNQCASLYAEIRLDEEGEDGTYGCRVDYQACPRIFSHNMWWDSKVAGVAVVQKCPNGAVGEAVRNCSSDGLWQEPDLMNCTNPAFLELETKVSKLESGELSVTTFVAKTTIASLANATSSTEKMFGNDLNITLRIMNLILDYENSQVGLNLTSEQSSTFLSNMVSALSDVLHEKHSSHWRRLNLENGGTADLIVKLETYLYTLASALELTSEQESPRPYNIITDSIVVGVDTLSKRNFSGKSIPKYNNIVKNSMFDEDTGIYIPQSAIKEAPYTDFLSAKAPVPKAYVGYVMYRSLGDLLPKSYSQDVRVVSGRPMSINSPVFTLILRDNRSEVTGPLSEPVVITFKQQLSVNRTSPQCVYWEPAGSRWSTDGCTMTDRYVQNGDTYVQCSCNHLTSFALLMDVSDQEVCYNGTVLCNDFMNINTDGCTMTDRYVQNGDTYVQCSCNHLTSFALLMDVSDQEYIVPEPVTIEVIVYICLLVSMGCLVLAFLVLFCFKHLQSNRTSIHTNLVFVFFLCALAFVVGVNRTDSELFCRLVAIALHYFYMTGFSWLFVDILHIYRMLTEIRNIDIGTMKFYYLVAYVIPGIIVSLAVGLNTEGYGNTKFCWLKMSDKFIWSFAGPITFSGILSVFVFVMSMKAFCREKITVTDVTSIRVGLFANIIILMLWALIWVIGLLAVNYSVTALHYFFAILFLSLGVFVFLIYILASSKVRFELKKLWYKVRGRKLDLDDNIGGTRSSLYSRSALAYRHDDPDGGIINHVSVGISTTSTTSKSTSRSSGGIYKGEDYLRSTSTSTSGNIPAYKKSAGVPPPYGYDPEKNAQLDDPDSIQIRSKPTGNDTDSDSEMSEGHASLDLASSHSSDEDDDLDLNWESQLPKNKKIEYRQLLHHLGQLVPKEEAKEQARLKQKKDEEEHHKKQQEQQRQHSPFQSQQQRQQSPFQSQQQQQNQHNPFQSEPFQQFHTVTPPPIYNSLQHGHWPGDPLLTGYTGSESEYRSSDQPTLSSVQPDVTLQTPEYKGREFIRTSPRQTDSPLNDSNTSFKQGSYSSPYNSPRIANKIYQPGDHMGSPIGRTKYSPREHIGSPVGSPNQDRMTVKVLTHRGSVSSDSECSHETSV